jgi:hypothetical protein
VHEPGHARRARGVRPDDDVRQAEIAVRQYQVLLDRRGGEELVEHVARALAGAAIGATLR